MPDGPAADAVLLSLDGFEGPLDLLLELARGQKVDLARVSVAALADQYVAAVEAMGAGPRPPPLDRAADWLVMAAWLTWLKSRLLLPRGSAEAAGAAAAAGLLTDRLGELDRIRALAAWLGERPQTGRDTWAHAPAEPFAADAVHSDLAGLLEAYLGHFRTARERRRGRGAAPEAWRPVPLGLWTVADAVERLGRMLAVAPEGGPLGLFLPPPPPSADDPPGRRRLRRRAAVAGTLVGALELAREGRADLRQEAPFEDVLIVPLPRADPARRSDGAP